MTLFNEHVGCYTKCWLTLGKEAQCPGFLNTFLTYITQLIDWSIEEIRRYINARS